MHISKENLNYYYILKINKMGLEDIIKAKKNFEKSTAVARAFSEDKPQFLEALYNFSKLTPAEQNSLESRTKYQHAKYVDAYQTNAYEGLAKAVENNYDLTIKKIPDKDLVNILVQLPVPKSEDKKEDKRAELYEKIHKIAEGAQKGDFDAYIKDVAKRNEYAAMVFASMNENGNEKQLAGLAMSRVQELSEGLKNSFDKIVTENGRQKAVTDYQAMRSYIDKTVRSYSKDNKIQVYTLLGSYIKEEKKDKKK